MKKNGSKYLGRSIHKDKFVKSLVNGNLKQMLIAINNDNDLDIQIRNDYLNIYYKGGNIAKVNSEKSIGFDEFYFYLEMKKAPKKEIMNNKTIVQELRIKRNLMTQKFKTGDYKEYFSNAKEVMDEWLVINPKPERMEQHQLSISNQYNKSDYTIIDLEYQVSTKRDFACKFIPKGKDIPKKPRFDIIAINKLGEVCIIELKKGIGALKGISGLKEHWDCYKESIGRNYEPFVSEIKKLLKQKQDFNLIDKQIEIKKPIPEFIFAYSYDNKTSIEKQDELFDEQYKKIGTKIKVIRLKTGKLELRDNKSD